MDDEVIGTNTSMGWSTAIVRLTVDQLKMMFTESHNTSPKFNEQVVIKFSE
jgi:hypothetical protein